MIKEAFDDTQFGALAVGEVIDSIIVLHMIKQRRLAAKKDYRY